MQLAYDVAWRAACETRYRTEAFQVSAMADRALSGFAAATISDERFTFLDAARRNVRNEAGMRIAQLLSVFGFFRRLDDTLPNRFFARLGSFLYQEHTA